MSIFLAWTQTDAPAYQISIQDSTRVTEFTRALDNHYYIHERNAAPYHIQRQLTYSKLAEIGVEALLREKAGFPEGQLDFEIREGNQKGWVADILYPDGKATHVKATDAVYGRCPSWVFQLANVSNAGGCDPLLADKAAHSHHLVAFTYVDFDMVYLLGLVQWGEIKESYFEDPIKRSLKGLKKCIYHDTLLRQVA